MKKILFLIFIGIVSVTVSAQERYSPTTTWPYLYADFTEGEVQLPSGEGKPGKYNISLADNKLHFIDGDMVKEANSADVFAVRIGQDVFTNFEGSMLQVLAKSDKCLVVEESTIDYAALNETGGAYGSSSNTVGTMALSSVEGVGGGHANINHMELKSSKDDGKILTLTKKMFIIVGGKKIYASKKDVLDVDGIDKEALSAFIKENKIKWKDAQSVLQVGDYLAK